MTSTDQRISQVSESIGVTRIADVTGFDRIGVPVVMVVRPNSRGYCVTQGKGLTIESARWSGLFEAAEGYHAENIAKPLRYSAFDEFPDGQAVVPCDLARANGRNVSSGERFLWIKGCTIQGREKWVPFESVHTDYSVPNRAIPNLFLCSSNGLAAGAYWEDAALHGLLEVIERDSEALFRAADRWNDPHCRIRLDRLPYSEAKMLVDRLRSADVVPYAWNMTSDLAIPAIYVTLVDEAAPVTSAVKLTSGSASRPTGEAALVAALLEGIQSRATVIAGTRDDLFFEDYLDIDEGLVAAKLDRLNAVEIEGCLPPSASSEFKAICRLVETRLQREIVQVDLSKQIEGVHVVRTIAPGLEGVPEHSQYHYGRRARAIARREH